RPPGPDGGRAGGRIRGRPPLPRSRRVLRPPQGRAFEEVTCRLRTLVHRSPPGRGADADQHTADHLRREERTGQGQPPGRLVLRRPPRLCPRLRSAGQSTAVAGLPLDRMPALHPPRRRGRGPPRRTVGGNEQNRMRTPHMSIDNTSIDNTHIDNTSTDDAHIDNGSRTGPSTLDVLESEAIHTIREVAAEFERPVLLFSGGKDSVTVLHLAAKAFWPAKIPFGLLHVDTGHNFDEIIRFRDETAQRFGLDLTVANVQDYIDDGRLRERPDGTRNTLQTQPLIDAIAAGGFDAVFGGARRDEDKARAKERIISLR